MEDDLKKNEKMEDDLKKREDDLKKKWKTTKKKKKKEDNKKNLKKWNTNQSTKINLIGCDTIVNSPSLLNFQVRKYSLYNLNLTEVQIYCIPEEKTKHCKYII